MTRSKPWKKSTGPRSWLGKKTASQNALKHGLCSRWSTPAQRTAYASMMRQLRRTGQIPPNG